MKTINYYVAVFILLYSNLSFSNCSKLLKIEIEKKLGTPKEIVFGDFADFIYSVRNEKLLSSLSSLGDKQEIFSKKMGIKDLLIQKVIESKVAGEEITESLTIARNAMNDPKLISEWIEVLHRDIVLEHLINGRNVEISNLNSRIVLTQRLVLKVLYENAKKAGFTKLQILRKLHDEIEFSRVLMDKKLILDNNFYNSRHGRLIHLFHVDFMIYAFKKANLGPVRVSELFKWLGLMHTFTIEGYSIKFNSLSIGWQGLFDSFERDLTSPEKLNPLILDYLKINES